jgi:hypothetical protein
MLVESNRPLHIVKISSGVETFFKEYFAEKVNDLKPVV